MFLLIFLQLQQQLFSINENNMFFEEVGTLSKAAIVQEPRSQFSLICQRRIVPKHPHDHCQRIQVDYLPGSVLVIDDAVSIDCL